MSNSDRLMLAMAAEEFLKPPFARTFSMMFSQEQFADDLSSAKNAHSNHVADMRKALSNPSWDDDDWEGWYADYLINLWWKRVVLADNSLPASKVVDAHLVPHDHPED